MTTINEPADWPDVDVVMPVRNEAAHLAAAVAAVRNQEYAGRLRIFLAVGPSIDGTERVAALLASESDDLVVVDNPRGLTPCGLNAAIRAGRGPVVVRVDGHSELAPGYVQRAVSTMASTGAVNVGGRQVPMPTTGFERAVADATTSWLGTGGATYRVGGEPGPVDTVFLGVFDRSAIEAIGLFDERLIRNQDYELNIRLREAGGTVWFDPEMSVGYRPRGSWRALATQYRQYGYWKAIVLRRHPSSLRLRQLVPPLGVGAAAAGLAIGVRRPLALILPGTYAAVVAASSAASGHSVVGAARVAAVATTMHLCWSFGLVVGILSGRRRR